MLKKLEILFL